MTFDNDWYTLSSGRTFYANGGILGLGPGDAETGSVSHGYDGGFNVIEADTPWTAEERTELADEMIRRWIIFKMGASIESS